MEPSHTPSPARDRPPHRLTLDELSALALGQGPDFMTASQLYFRIGGRISRRTFWLHGVGTLLLIAVLGNAMLDIAGLESELNGKLVNAVLAWPYIAVSAKRLHDFNRSAWWMLINLIPGIGSLVTLLANGCMRGRRGPNRFGPDPRHLRARHALYLLNNAH